MTTAAPPPDVAGTSALVERLDALGVAAARLRAYTPGPALETEHWLGLARQRLRHGADHTIVALAGTTGSGKSSLLNAVAGAPVATAGVTRPTTAAAQAMVVARDRGDGVDADGGVAAVLDWLEVPRRHHVAGADVGADLGGLVLLDLPDIDSVETSHHLEAARLIEVVDLLVWVTDPQKYADRTLHLDHLAPLAGHAGSLAVLLNKVDTLTPAQTETCLEDLDRLLDEDGLPQVRPLPVSATTGEGMNALLGLLAAEVAARRAMVDRIEAGLGEHAGLLAEVVAGPSSGVGTSDVTGTLDDGLTRAVGVDGLAELVAERHRRAATLRTGWPVLRWRRRIRPRAGTGPLRPGRSAVARATVAGTLRDVGDAVAAATPAALREDARALVEQAVPPVVDALDRVTVRVADTLARQPRWWAVVGVLQTSLLAVAGVGLAWVLGVTVAEATLRIDPDPLLVRVEGVAVPTALLVGGLVLGVVVGALAGLAARVGAARRARRVREQVADAVAVVALDEVMAPLAALMSDLETARTALTAARTR